MKKEFLSLIHNLDLTQKFIFLSLLISLSIFISSCSMKSDNPNDKKKELSKLKSQLAEIQKKIQKLELEIKVTGTNDSNGYQVHVNYFEITPATFRRYIEVQGVVESQKAVMVSSRMGGVVEAIYVTPGQNVSKGQILMKLDDALLQKSLLELNNQLDFVNTLYEKQKRLYDKKAISEVQFLSAKNQKESLDKRLETLKGQIAFANVVAPFSGVIDNIIPKVGESVGSNVPVIRLTSLEDVRVTANVSETYASTLKKGAEATLEFTDVNEKIEAKVTMAAKAIDPMNRAFKIQIKLPKVPEYIKPNMVCNVFINDLVIDNAFTIPISIVQRDGDKNFVFVVEQLNGNFVAKKRFVKLGVTYKDKIQVIEGLSAGDKIIIDGALDVTDGQKLIAQSS